MSVFGRILEKLGMRKDKAPPSMNTQAQAGRKPGASPTAPNQQAPQASAPGAQRQAPPPAQGQQGGQQAQPGQQNQNPQAQSRPQPLSETDVVGKLERLAAENPQKLNWRSSIVDLMKLLGMESSLSERRELAEELGYPREDMEDTAKMNVWLHKQVLRRIAENGGNVPKDMLN
jgi:hypothetical protein